MLRGVQRSSALLRSCAVKGSRARCPRAVLPAAADARAGVGARPHPRSQGAAFDSSAAGQARWMSAATPGSTEDKKDEPEAKGFLSKLMSKESCVASPSFTNRWAMVAPAFLTHMCIGSPWAWSVMSGTISRELGIVSSAAGDWSMAEATMPMSIVFATLGLAAALGGSWAHKVGPRMSMSAASLFFGGGVMIGGLGVEYHSLPLLYGGYGVLAGTGLGLAYTPPIQTLMGWFPDKRALASGLTIAGFGSGALVFAPLVNTLMEKFSKMPTYLGTMDQVSTVMNEGKLFAKTASGLVEVVSVNSSELARLPYDLAEGVYVVGTGSTGAAAALGVCGALYGGIMLASAMTIKSPAPGYKVPGLPAPSASEEKPAPAVQNNVAPNVAMKTPQFFGLGVTNFFVGCTGFGLFSVAKPMMGEVFSNTLPTLVTASFASAYVQMLALGSLGGRIGWAAFSDKFGRKLTFQIFTLGSVPLYLADPAIVHNVIATGSAIPLGMFIGSTFLAITFMGGVYAVLPAYEADLFGTKYVGPIHGRLMASTSAAALFGPSFILSLRSSSEMSAINDLLEKVDPARFQKMFNTGVEDAQMLIDSKALTIGKLMELVPAGTPDPTPFIYDSTLYTMAGLMGVAAVAHSTIRPMNPKYFEKADTSPLEVESVLRSPVAAAVGGGAAFFPSMASHMVPASVLPLRK
ncbi:unnamed protein product [Ectocarpus sp. CCAP 1310/34]|nr:unnamed protein product [Ectocarpus sp. CCAP 1310/34]